MYAYVYVCVRVTARAPEVSVHTHITYICIYLDGVGHGVGLSCALCVLGEQPGELNLEIEPELHRGAQRLDLCQLGEGHAEDAGLG